MRSKNRFAVHAFAFAWIIAAPAALAQLTIQHSDGNGGWGIVDAPREHLPEAEHARVWDEVQANIRKLREAGKVGPLKAKADVTVRFAWPTRFAAGRPEFFDHTVGNYIDHNPVVGALRDYTCGTRSYDTASGGHRGTDIGIGARAFYKMDTEQVVVVAAAPGVIVFKDDANPDRSCGNLTELFSSTLKNNVIVVEHADGTIGIYFHVKTGSATAKNVGESVEEGEYLAVIGSSGFSSTPHLHFEVRNADNSTIDPWVGSCNPTTTVSLWKSQQPYRVKELLSVMPSSAFPTNDSMATACTSNVAEPETASGYLQPDFHAQAGVTHHFTAFLRDREVGDTVVFSLRRPDNSEFSTFTINVASAASSSFVFHSKTIPASEPVGRWAVAVTYAGKTRSTPFWFGQPAPKTVRVHDFHHAGLDHYFRTANAAEAQGLTPATGFVPTGDDFIALDRSESSVGVVPVCRFYGSVNPGPNSHFYTGNATECAWLQALQSQTPSTQPRWNFEETAFSAYLPVDGVCPQEAPFPVYRLYNRHQGETVDGVREDSNHRFTTLSSVYYAMGQRGWAQEGVVMCAQSKP